MKPPCVSNKPNVGIYTCTVNKYGDIRSYLLTLKKAQKDWDCTY